MTAPTKARSAGIVARGVVKRFRAVTALDGVDITVAPGEVVALLGANGAGKSTLLRILGTTVLPDEGQVSIAGHDVVGDPRSVRQSVGLVLGDERAWYWRLSGRKNLEFFATLHGMSRTGGRQRADALLSQVGLADAADRRVDGYSSGMKARLALARALISEPAVLLLDEPTRSLDPLAAVAFRDDLLQLVRTRSRAALIATHDLHEAAAVADRVVVLNAGRVTARLDCGGDAAALERLLVDAVSA